MTTNKVTATVRGCTVEVEPHDGGVHIHEIGRTPTDGSERYESAFHVDADGWSCGQGFLGRVSEDEQAAIDDALHEAIAQARARWPEVESIFAARDRLCAQR